MLTQLKFVKELVHTDSMIMEMYTTESKTTIYLIFEYNDKRKGLTPIAISEDKGEIEEHFVRCAMMNGELNSPEVINNNFMEISKLKLNKRRKE